MSHSFFVNPSEGLPIRPRDLAERLGQQRPWGKHLEGRPLFATELTTIGGVSPFFNAAAIAFNEHFGWTISPDAVWLTILNGLVHHIDQDPEAVRHHFVQHPGKLTLEVVTEGGSMEAATPDNWMEGIRGFAEKIQDAIGKKHDLIVNNFSTTTPTDRLSSQVALMGAMRHYFEFKHHFLCGLTRVTVTGTPEDWGDIAQRVRALSEVGLGWWTEHLSPVIDQFRLACEGKPDIDFWKAMYKRERFGSGGQGNITGWINALFPYTNGPKTRDPGRGKMLVNRSLNWQDPSTPGTEDNEYPSGIIAAPVEVIDFVGSHRCEFNGGLVGVTLSDDLMVEAKSGWAIHHLGD